MFPTGVGMNRQRCKKWVVQDRVPHRRGDEPYDANIFLRLYIVFPTGVGMNRVCILPQ